jgi:hypothetical protein
VAVVGGAGDDLWVGPAEQPVMATAAAKMNAVMIRTGRMTAPQAAGTSVGPQQQGGWVRSRHRDEPASPQWQKGLDSVAILDRKQRAF